MRFFRFSVLAAALLTCCQAAIWPELKLVKAYSVEPIGPYGKFIEPSGLIRMNGKFYAITDKQDDVLWEVRLEKDVANFYPIHFDLPPDTPKMIDWESLCPLPNGRVGLLSERVDRVLEVNPKNGKSRWITPAVTKEAQSVGLMTEPNAHGEGVVCLAPGKFLIAAERQSRGLVEVDTATTPARISPTLMNFTKFPLPLLRFTDFSDLWMDGQRIFALCRNAGGISELVRTEKGWDEKPLWRYRTTVESDPYQFENMIFGMAEGMCMDKDSIYLVLDNNRIARKGLPKDQRSWFFVFERPKEN